MTVFRRFPKTFTPQDNLRQFLTESLVLSLGGGLIGSAFSIGIAWQLASSFGWPLLIRTDVILMVAGFSAFVGVAFGLYPARKASLLDPIDALRYE